MFLSFFDNLNDNLDKFLIYMVIFRKYLSISNIKVKYEECEIDVKDDKNFKLIS